MEQYHYLVLQNAKNDSHNAKLTNFQMYFQF